MSEFDAKAMFEQIEKELEPILAAKGYAKTKHDYHPQTFGNMYTVFSSGSGHVRFTWDGKSQAFILRVYKKRSRFMNTVLMSFLGKYDLDKMIQEIIVQGFEVRTLPPEELVKRFTGKLDA